MFFFQNIFGSTLRSLPPPIHCALCWKWDYSHCRRGILLAVMIAMQCTIAIAIEDISVALGIAGSTGKLPLPYLLGARSRVVAECIQPAASALSRKGNILAEPRLTHSDYLLLAGSQGPLQLAFCCPRYFTLSSWWAR